MLPDQPQILEIYCPTRGNSPFKNWYLSIRDLFARARIQARLDMLEEGHYGDFKFIGKGVYELRVHRRPGYRIYFAPVAPGRLLILCGGDKNNQQRDIAKAERYLADYRSTQQ